MKMLVVLRDIVIIIFGLVKGTSSFRQAVGLCEAVAAPCRICNLRTGVSTGGAARTECD